MTAAAENFTAKSTTKAKTTIDRFGRAIIALGVVELTTARWGVLCGGRLWYRDSELGVVVLGFLKTNQPVWAAVARGALRYDDNRTRKPPQRLSAPDYLPIRCSPLSRLPVLSECPMEIGPNSSAKRVSMSSGGRSVEPSEFEQM